MINILIIHYNTPFLTECLIRSINRNVRECHIYIFDNSDIHPFTYKQSNLTILDNTKGEIINFDEWLKQFPYVNEGTGKRGSARHCYSVEVALSIINDNVILMDSDVLLKKDITDIWDENSLAVGTIIKQWDGNDRLAPFLCFINYNKMKMMGKHYFSPIYMHGLSNDSIKNSFDTGRFFLQDIGTSLKKIDIKDYIIHYGNGSWVEKHDSLPHRTKNNIGEKRTNEASIDWAYRNQFLWWEEKIILTMTSWKKRISNIPTVLTSILNNTKLPDKIIINLSIDEFPNKKLPLSVENFIKDKPLIEINWLNGDIRQWKKTIPTMLKYPYDSIICIDDDRIYGNNFIKALYEKHLQCPNNPITLNSHYYLKGKYLQHAGHGTLDKAYFYNNFENILSDELYDMASSDTFFTLISNNYNHPQISVDKFVDVKMYNEFEPLRKTEKTCDISSHDIMYDFLKNRGYINELLQNKTYIHNYTYMSQQTKTTTNRNPRTRFCYGRIRKVKPSISF